jgi:hypothetical protein
LAKEARVRFCLGHEQDIPPLENRSAAASAARGPGVCGQGPSLQLCAEPREDDIDLVDITSSYDGECGQPPFDPVMMTALLLYSLFLLLRLILLAAAYTPCCRLYSWRRIAMACRERVDFISIVGLDVPDFHTILEFRSRHLKAFS